MYLYDNDGEFVCIYELVPKTDKIKEYKKREMEKIPEGARLWTSIASSIDDQIFLQKVHQIPSSRLDFYIPYVSGVSSHRLLLQECENGTIDNYYNSYSSFGNPLKVKKGKTNKNIPDYFIVTENNYIKDNYNYIMRNIIAIPESLYLLELLLGKRYDLIRDINDVCEQLDLFEVKEINRIKIQLLHDMRDYGMISNENVEELVTRKRRILSLNKKKPA